MNGDDKSFIFTIWIISLILINKIEWKNWLQIVCNERYNGQIYIRLAIPWDDHEPSWKICIVIITVYKYLNMMMMMIIIIITKMVCVYATNNIWVIHPQQSTQWVNQRNKLVSGRCWSWWVGVEYSNGFDVIGGKLWWCPLVIKGPMSTWNAPFLLLKHGVLITHWLLPVGLSFSFDPIALQYKHRWAQLTSNRSTSGLTTYREEGEKRKVW